MITLESHLFAMWLIGFYTAIMIGWALLLIAQIIYEEIVEMIK